MSEKNVNLYKTVFENSPVGLLLVNRDTSLREANQYIFKALNLSPTILKGQKFGNVFNCFVATSFNGNCGTMNLCKECVLMVNILQVLNHGIILSDTLVDHNFTINGMKMKKRFKLSASRIESEDDLFAIVALVDITTQMEYEDLLNDQLSLDLATGTRNKHALMDTLESLIASKQDFTIAMIDFDNFKSVNDSHGHIVGDRVLSIFSSVSLNNIRRHDIVGRFGGEEFMLVFPGASSALLIKALQRISKSFRDGCEEELHISPTFSVGVAHFSAQEMIGTNVDAIISEADTNLYLSKSRGKNMITTSEKSIPFK
jgi:diguanylate cyclase (GGDEF)-like protein